MKKIILILPYFGKFRNDNDFWLKSIESNKSVNFLLFTDQDIKVPSNVKLVHTTFDKFKALIQQKFDFKINIPQAYKLCDFRPAFGEIFQNYIHDFDFWGHCDNDLIFGDIRHFITDDILEKYERILVRGHFTLYKNINSVNNSFKEATPSYKSVFSSSKNCIYDETPGTGGFWIRQKSDKLYNEIIFDDIYYLSHKFITVHKKVLDKHRKHFIYSFENGKLYRIFNEQGNIGKEETMYVHFQKRNLKIKTQVSNYFTIIPNEYIDYVANPTIDFLKKNAKGHLLYPQYFKIKFKTLKRKIKSLLNQ